MAVSTLDPIVVQVSPGTPEGVFGPPVIPVVYTTNDMWCGVFVARPEPDLHDDRSTITSFGFTILLERPEAGETHVYAWGVTSQVSNWTGTRVRLQTELPYFFWKLPKEVPLTVSLLLRGPAHPGDLIKF